MPTATEQPQTAIDEQVVTHPQLLAALDTHAAAKAKAGEATKAKAEALARVKALAEEHNIEVGQAIRVGDYRLTMRAVEGKSVSFDTAPRTQLSIATVE